MSRAVVLVPVRTVSESNVREHWAKRARRASQQRTTVLYMLNSWMPAKPLPATVTLTRISPGILDDDNLRGSLKFLRDGVADWFGVNDRDPRISWEYAQRRSARGQYAVEVAVEGKEKPPTAAE